MPIGLGLCIGDSVSWTDWWTFLNLSPISMEGKVMPMLCGRGSALRAEPGLLLGECHWYPDRPASPPAAGSSLLEIYASNPSLVHLPADRSGDRPVLPESREPGFEPVFWSTDGP